MSSETDDPCADGPGEPGLSPGRGEAARRPRAADDEREFVCRESSVAVPEGGILTEIMCGLPLRAGFTEEVLARIAGSALSAEDQTPMP